MNESVGVDRLLEAIDELDLSDEAADKAVDFYLNAVFNHPINGSPNSIAGGAIYAATTVSLRIWRSQQDVAEAVGVSPRTVGRQYREILEAEGYQLTTSESSEDPEPETLLDRVRVFLGGSA